jgi:hypothetical protein
MIAALAEFVVSFLLEFLLESVVESAAELGIYSLEQGRRSPSVGPIMRMALYLILGAALGFLSTYLVQVHVIRISGLRVALMLFSPISMGLMLCLTSWFIYRKDRHQPFWSTQKFVTGAVFGAAYSLSRAFFVDVV